jgi:phosphoglycolate phosphatase-like HAD superfamily hydrolase
MKGFEAVLFDMDGTLIYSKGVIGKCLNLTLEHFGYAPFEDKELRKLIGVPLSSALSLKTAEWQPLVEHYRKLYLDTYLNGTFVMEGMLPILDILKKEGKKIGIVTLKSKPVAEIVLKGLKLDRYIDAVDGDDDISELKPSPFQINRICKSLDVESVQCVMVGDTSMDIAAGKNANCRTIGVLWGAMSMDLLVEAEADFIARSPKELEVVLKNL